MPRAPFKYDQIIIQEQAYRKLLMWSQSLNEIGFVAAGNANVIREVFRLRNYAKKSRTFLETDFYEEEKVKKQIKKLGLSYIAFGHSHPQDQAGPSKYDVENLPLHSIQIIVFPKVKKVKIWKIGKSWSATLKSEIKVTESP